MAVRRDYIADLYRNVLGREGSEGEISGWENAPDESSVEAMFYGSPEYTSKHGGDATWQDINGVITPSGDDAYRPPSRTPDTSTTDPTSNGGWPDGGVTGNSPQDQIADLYTRYLGRSASPDEISRWLAGTFGWGDSNNIGGIERGISTSEEASRHRAANPTTSYSTSPYTGFTANHDYSAFNTGRQQDPARSAKDAFAMISNQAPPPPFSNKAAMANWFNTYVRPGMDAMGHRVLSVNEDGFTYTNHEGTFFVDFGQNSGAAPGTMLQRLQWNATPADDATRARYASGAASSTGTGTPSATTTQRAGSSPSAQNFAQLGAQYGGPGSSGVYTNGPVQQVGQDPLSQLITGGLADFLLRGGRTPFGEDVESALRNRIGDDGFSDPDLNARYESARELMSKARRTQTNDARAALADRGLLSEPGIPQGAEITAMRRIEENIAPEFSRAMRDIFTDESQRADARVLSSLQMAANLSQDQARTFLAGIGEGTARQTALAQLALQSLGQNMTWAQFLAEFGLKRDEVLNQLQSGRIDDVMGLLNAFLSLASLSRGGYVGG